MTTFQAHTLETAPEGSRETLEAVKKAFGGIPNLFAVFSESPAIASAYFSLGQLFDTASGFDATERQVVLLSTSLENECEYCMAAHTAISKMQEVPDDVVQSLRLGEPIADPKLEALRTFTLAVVRERGRVDPAGVQAFLDAGYTKRAVLDVILGVGIKTLSNYTNHLANTELDANFAPFAWSKPAPAPIV